MKAVLLFTAVLNALSLSSLAQAGPYSINQTSIGRDFLTNFQWEDITDPTKGRVYVTTTADIFPYRTCSLGTMSTNRHPSRIT